MKGLSTKKTILFIMHYPPPVNGASFMGRCIRESNVINETFNTKYINLTTAYNLNSIGKAGFSKLFTTLGIIVSIIRALRKTDVDLCYMTLTAKGAGFYKDMLIVTVLKIYRKKIIYHFHNKGIAEFGKNPINNLLYRYVFRNTKSILLSPRLMDDIKLYVSESMVYYCPNGIPVVAKSTLAKKRSAINGVCRILFVSNLLTEKGFKTLLEACQVLKTKGIDFECHFIGGWIDITKDDFTKYVEEKGLDRVVYGHGPKYDNEKYEYFLNADIFVFPTYYHNETFGLVNLEAMQFRLPVIFKLEDGDAGPKKKKKREGKKDKKSQWLAY